MKQIKLLALSAALVCAANSYATDIIDFPNITTTGNATLATDNMFRGISLSSNNAAVYGQANLAHSSGVFFNVWGSSIASSAGGSEVKVTLGYEDDFKSIDKSSFSLGASTYIFPGENKHNNNNYTPEFNEVFAALNFKDRLIDNDQFSLKVTYSNRYHNNSGQYYNASLNYETPLNNLLGVVGHVGYNKFENERFMGRFTANGTRIASKSDYLDYKAGVTFTANGFKGDISYVGTNIDDKDCPNGLCDGRFVFGLSKNF